MISSTHSGCLWKNRDVLLYLCRFIEGQELVLFAASCQLIYRAIVDRPDYWERQYQRTFSLGDQREQEWFTWYNWHISTTVESKSSLFSVNKKKQEHLLSSNITTVGNNNSEYTSYINNLPSTPDFAAIRWFYAYQRRRQAERNFMAGRFKKRACRLPVDEYTRLSLVDVNPWYALVKENNRSKMWSIRHDASGQKNERCNKELPWKELTIPSLPSLFNGKALIEFVHGTNQFIVAYMSISTYNDVKPVAVGDPIVKLNELEERHMKENESENSTALEKRSIVFPNTVDLEERKSCIREAIAVWSNAGYLPPNFIYLEDRNNGRKEPNTPYLVDIYNNWILFQTKDIQDSYNQFYLLNLNRNKWAEGPRYKHDYDSYANIQFTSCNQCQLLVWKVIGNPVKTENTFMVASTQNPQNIGNDQQSLCIEWDLFNFQQKQSPYETVLSGRVTIPYYSNATIKTEMYSRSTCLIIAFDLGCKPDFGCNTTFKASLSLFGLGKLSSNNYLQSLFDANDCNQLLPINSSDQGHIVWSRIIDSRVITKLYSEKLIVVQNYKTFDVLNARMEIYYVQSPAHSIQNLLHFLDLYAQ
ncbi:hypothetical protein BDF19DRAFT_167191 [Syncephalis fuscata]|nr:hypothetical protein BDF19DRAFT_167191 [Syncephalis fuscata]